MNTLLLQTFIWFRLTVLLRSHHSLLGSSAQPNPYLKLYHLWDTRMLRVCLLAPHSVRRNLTPSDKFSWKTSICSVFGSNLSDQFYSWGSAAYTKIKLSDVNAEVDHHHCVYNYTWRPHASVCMILLNLCLLTDMEANIWQAAGNSFLAKCFLCALNKLFLLSSSPTVSFTFPAAFSLLVF